jgi:nitroreductase
METKSAILKRKSCRKYIEKSLDHETVKAILEAGMAAPSAINRQPWEFYIIKNKEVQKTLKDAMPYSKYNSDLLIVVAGNLLKEIFIKSQEFFVEDCSAAIENMLIRATDLGVASCWTAIYPDEKRMDSVRTILNIKKSIIPFAIVHFGYSDEELVERTKYNEKKIHVIN